MQQLEQFLQNSSPYLFIIAGIIIIVYALFKKSLSEKLKGNGVYADAVVYKQGHKRIGSASDMSDAPDKITLRFTTQSNEWITTVAKNDFGLYYTGQYSDGETVQVLYDPANPSDCIILSKQSEITARIVSVVIGVAFIIGGLYFELV